MSGKFYEYDPKLPSMKQLTDCKFSENDTKKSEMICLKLLGYKLDRNSAYDFLEYFLKQGIVFEDELHVLEEENHEKFTLKEIYDFPYKILNFFLFDSRYLDFSPLQIACAIITFTRKKFNLKESWNNKFSEIYNIKLEDFMNCYFVVKTIYIAEKEQKQHKENQIYHSHRSIEKKNSENSDLYINLRRDSLNKLISIPSIASYYNYNYNTPTMAKRRSVNEYYFLTNFSGDEMNSTLDESYCLHDSRSKSISNSSVHKTKYRNSVSNINTVYQISRNLTSNFNLYGANYNSTGQMATSVSPYNWNNYNNSFNPNYSFNNCFNRYSVITDNSNNVNNYFFQ